MFGRPQTGQREVKKGSIPTRLELKNESPVWRIIVSAHLGCVINVRIKKSRNSILDGGQARGVRDLGEFAVN